MRIQVSPVLLVRSVATLTKLAPDNPLQTAVLNLFVALKYRFPNLVVGSITRDSVKKALNNGISAEQVCVVSRYTLQRQVNF
jgi:thiamine monophosphate synthase